MVWRINRKNRTCYNLKEDVMFQSTNMLLNIHSSDYSAFDMYHLWRVGINMFNIDRTVHDGDFFSEVVQKISEARNCNYIGYYRPIGIVVTLSAIDHIDIGEDICDSVDVVALKDVETVDDIIQFRRKNKKLTEKPTLVWVSTYGLDDMKLIIKMSDGLILNFYDEKRTLQVICVNLIKQCREMHKPIIIYRRTFLKLYADKPRQLLPIANNFVNLLCDGLLLEDLDEKEADIYKVYTVFCALQFAEKQKLKQLDDKQYYFKMRAELTLPVTPPLSAALGASLAAIYTGAKVIMLSTRTGRSARWVSCAFPPGVVLAITTQPSTARRLHIYRKILPLYYGEPKEADKMAEWRNREKFAKKFCVNICLMGYGSKYIVLSPGDDDGYCSRVEIKEVRF